MADGVGRHVGQDEIGCAAERIDEQGGRGIGHEVHLHDGHALDRVDRQQVDPDHRGVRQAALDDLAPAARRDAEIDDAASARRATCPTDRR